MKKWFVLLILFSQLASGASRYQVATQERTFYNGSRTLSSVIYYPTESQQTPKMVGTRPVFDGIESQPDAPAANGTFPLIIFSHGSGGNSFSQAWLARALVERGVIVVAANHPGSTSGNSIPAESVKLWLQTQDISALINAIMQDQQWQQRINRDAIGVLGHSKGGYSAIASVGGRVSLQDFVAGCHISPQSPNCQFYTQANVNLAALPAKAFDANFTDKRLSFAIALDPGMVPYLQPNSLRQLNAPLLIVASEYFRADTAEANLAGASLAAFAGKWPIDALTLAGANHFDFLPTCTSTALQWLAEEGETFICASDRLQREQAHRQTIAAVLAFIQPWLTEQNKIRTLYAPR